MTQTATDLLKGIEGVDPIVVRKRANEKKLVSLTTDIKRIIQFLDMMAEGADNRAYTTFDLTLALNTVESVIHNRLSLPPNEHQGDEKNEYGRLWTSIESEACDAVNDLFGFTEHNRVRYSRFVNDFNKLIVSKLVKILKIMGPEKASVAVSRIVASIVTAIETNQQDLEPKDAYQQLRAYARNSGSFDRKPQTKAERLKMIGSIARRIRLAEEA